MEKWRTPFIEAGLALGAICSRRLYREKHTTFEAYCRDRWRCSPHYAHRLIRAAELVARMTIAPGPPRPVHESQVRPLVGLRPDQAQLAWEYAARMPCTHRAYSHRATFRH